MPLPPHLVGYAVPLVAKPGQRVGFHLSAGPATRAAIRIVRLACTNPEPVGPPERLVPAGFGPAGHLDLARQPLDPGSRLEVDLRGRWLPEQFTFALAVMPRRVAQAATLLSLHTGERESVALALDPGGCALVRLDGHVANLGITLAKQHWHLLSVTVDRAAGEITVRHRQVAPGMPADRQGSETTGSVSFTPLPDATPIRTLTIGAGPLPARGGFDGLIDLPMICHGIHNLLNTLIDPEAETRLAKNASLIAGFSFRATGGNLQFELQGRFAGRMIHQPLTAVKGVRWTGETHDRRLRPEHYSAMQFNADAMIDAGWPETLGVTVPETLPSGVYALELTDTAGNRGFAPFFVSAAGSPKQGLAFLAPTFSYLAYCNAPEAMRGPPSRRGLLPAEALLDAANGRFGRSLYERFTDGSGVVVTGERKPLLSIGPDFRLWGFAADSLFTDWLERQEMACDLLTDHDLHHDGEAALNGIRVLITGSHPEYWSTRMWDALSGWLAKGGRLLYLGGNGVYWRTAVAEDGAIEVRRAEDGTRAFIGEPAEYVHAFTDEAGGLWRRLGRPPQALLGVGMAAQGFSRSTLYRKHDDARNAETAFVFEGVSEEHFGAGGLMGGGAAGFEIDRYDVALGSDPGAWLLASSFDHAPDVLRTKEEMLSYVPPFRDARARSDIVLTVNENGGAVFAVGSIAWIGSLADPGSDGAAARITRNVITRFLDPAPLPRKRGPE